MPGFPLALLHRKRIAVCEFAIFIVQLREIGIAVISLRVKPLPGHFSRNETHLSFRVLRDLSRWFSLTYHGLKLKSPCPIPQHGPGILVCNHTSGADPMFLQSASRRMIRWMMAREYADFRPLRPIFQTVGVILVERSGRDLAATRLALRALEEGYILGVFPEGKIETTREILPFQSGIGFLAIKSGAPVFPAYLDGKQRGREMVASCFLPSEATLAFGPPVDLSDLQGERGGIEQAKTRIQNAVKKLRCFQ
jgi:1-acyl-sn-glycerol-3-phosphate acyltransferase